MYKKLNILEGQRFGSLSVVRELDRYLLPGGQKARRFLLKCDCGNTTEAFLLHFVRGRINSCGCVGKSRNGESKTKIFTTWSAMIARCKENYFESHLYFKRGITVSEEFRDYFKFRDWAYKNGYKKDLQLDRRNNNEGYFAQNCRFVSSRMNNNNKRNTIYILYDNKKTAFSLVLHEKKKHHHYSTIMSRIKRGWLPQEAVDKPIKKGRYFRK